MKLLIITYIGDGFTVKYPEFNFFKTPKSSYALKWQKRGHHRTRPGEKKPFNTGRTVYGK